MSPLNLKFKFISTDSLIYGAGIIIFNQESKQLQNRSCVAVNQKSEIERLNLKIDIEDFKKELFKITLKNDILNNVVMLGINDEIKRTYADSVKTQKMIDLIKEGDKNSLKAEIKNIILNVVEAEFILDINCGEYEKSENDDYDEMEVDEEDVLNDDADLNLGLDGGDIVKISAVMDPVKGTEMKQIKEGDEVYVKITDESEKAVVLKKNLNAIDDKGNLIPVLAYFYDFKNEDEKGEGDFIVKLSENTYGVCREYKSVKVKLFQISKEERLDEQDDIEIKSDSGFWAVVILIMLFIAVLSVYFFYMT